MPESAEYLQASTPLDQKIEDDLMSLETRDFERSVGMKGSESAAILPAITAYDLPFLSDEEADRLIVNFVVDVDRVRKRVSERARRSSDDMAERAFSLLQGLQASDGTLPRDYGQEPVEGT